MWRNNKIKALRQRRCRQKMKSSKKKKKIFQDTHTKKKCQRLERQVEIMPKSNEGFSRDKEETQIPTWLYISFQGGKNQKEGKQNCSFQGTSLSHPKHSRCYGYSQLWISFPARRKKNIESFTILKVFLLHSKEIGCQKCFYKV